MERRELIKLITMATGAAMAIPLSSAVITACSKMEPVKESNYTLQFFSEEDFSRVQNFLNFILPKTESPSAVEVGVHQIMDSMIANVYNKKQQDQYLEAWNSLKDYCTIEDEFDQLKEVLSLTDAKSEKTGSAFVSMKQQALAYYLSTKEIAMNHLNYLPVPGKYQACISLESVEGKAWAL